MMIHRHDETFFLSCASYNLILSFFLFGYCSVVHAPVKSVKFTSTASYTSSSNAINASSTTAADAIMYGLHNIGAAESIATYLDAVVVPTLSKARPSVAAEDKVKKSGAADTTGADTVNEAGVDDNTGTSCFIAGNRHSYFVKKGISQSNIGTNSAC